MEEMRGGQEPAGNQQQEQLLLWDYVSSDVLQEEIDSGRGAVLPLGAMEDHGPHLPAGTDNFIAGKVSALVCEKTGDLLLPCLNYTYVWSLGDRIGSISLSFDTLRRTICEIACELYRQGIRMLICMDAHLGNSPVVKMAFREVLERHPDMKCLYFSYLDYASQVAFSSPRLSGRYIHACEIETSVMLYAKPETVNMDKAVKNYPEFPKRSEYMNLRWSEFTELAVLGDPTCAAKDKGEQLVHLAAENIAALIQTERKGL